MGSAITLDANVVIGFLDPDDALHESASRVLEEHADDALDMPSIAYAETMIRAARRGEAELVDRFFDRAGIDVGSVDRATARHGAELRGRFTALTLADAIVLAWALRRGSRLVTLDAQLALAWDRVP